MRTRAGVTWVRDIYARLPVVRKVCLEEAGS